MEWEHRRTELTTARRRTYALGLSLLATVLVASGSTGPPVLHAQPAARPEIHSKHFFHGYPPARRRPTT